MTGNEKSPNGTISWWAIVILGFASLLLGFLVSTRSLSDAVFLVRGFGLFWLLSGIFSLVMYFSKQCRSALLVLAGILGLAAGLLVIQNLFWSPVIPITSVVTALGVLGLLIGATYLLLAFQLRDWGAGIIGAIGFLYGAMLILYTIVQFKGFLTVLSLLGMLWGIAAVLLAYRLHYSAAEEQLPN